MEPTKKSQDYCPPQLSLDIREEPVMANLSKNQASAPVATHELSDDIKTQKHWNLQAGLALDIENAVKEIFLQFSHPSIGNLERLMIPKLDFYGCYEEARAFDPVQTQAVLSEWFPEEGDWDRFFLMLDLLESTHCYWTREDIPIRFAGFELADAITLLQLDFNPHPTSRCSSSTWDVPMKKLAVHLVTKMDKMRKDQGYSTLIFDVE
ncbi:hypothetical protein PtB15_3B564 [Puccinia triticina]|nr:hypothetical protein PtB15_3B564 [Puccinia triticina]